MKREKRKTFTYSGKPSVRKAAMKRAKSEGLIFSELVEKLLIEYAEEIPANPLPGMAGHTSVEGPF